MEQRKTYTIDVNNRVLGRIAVKIALILRGKNRTDFAHEKDMGNNVLVKNASGIKLTGKKLEQKKYYHHTGYLGHLKETSLKKLFEKSPEEVLRKAVFGMLPRNKLRANQIKRLKFE